VILAELVILQPQRQAQLRSKLAVFVRLFAQKVTVFGVRLQLLVMYLKSID
jgi:hypothetical protein